MKARDVLDCLATRFCTPEWVFTEELSLVPGFIRNRRADAVAMNCFNGKPWGQSVVGFEVKVSRADFLAELKEPKKRLETYDGCDALFLAVPKGLVKPEEVPLDMGIIECWTKEVPPTQHSEASTAYYTKIKRQPPDMDKLPVPAAMTWQEKQGWRYQELDLSKLKPMNRSTAVAIIRAFDPERLNTEALNKTGRLEWEARQRKNNARYLKNRLDEALALTSMP